jgi:Xaa-Pro aminopeptidase
MDNRQAGMTQPTTPARFAERRERVRAQLGADGCMILPATPEIHVGADAELRYVVDSELYYLTGYTEPEAVLVLTGEAEGFTLFVRPRDPERELWTGVRGGVEAAQSVYGAQRVFPIDALETEIPRMIARCDRVYARTNAGRGAFDALIARSIGGARRSRARTGHGATAILDPGVILDEMRLFKDADEIRLIRHAAEISIASFMEARAVISDGARIASMGEWQVEAALVAGFRSRRASGEAFPSIVGSGANATVLHYTTNNDTLPEGGFVLVDAGARAHMYCADITRTWAVGRTSPELQAMHDIVRAAHAAGIRECRAGATIDAVDRAARSELIRGLIDLHIIEGPVDVALQSDDYKRYYPHRTCHWLGLDVHDVGSYVNADGTPRTLEDGMVFTVEPGLYFPAADERVPVALRGAGVRLEDDVLISDGRADVLTAALPLDASP